MKDALIVGMMRSFIGRKTLLTPQELCRQVLHELFAQNGINPDRIDFFVIGSAVSLKSSAQAVHKEIAMLAKMSGASTELVENACSSGHTAVYRAAQSIWHEGAELAIGGGVEVMSADAEATEMALTDPSGKKMYQLADEFAVEHGISKEEHDRYSAESYRRARENLFNTGNYATTIIYEENGEQRLLVQDELVTAHESFADYDKVAKKRPLKDCKIISYASSSKPADGAAFIVVASPRAARRLKLKALARFSAFARASGSEPRNFVAKPVQATAELLKKVSSKKNRLELTDADVCLINEAFATSPDNFMRETGVPLDRVNPRGGAIAMGHPLGMSGTRLPMEAVQIIQHEKKQRILVGICHAIDGATASLIEAI